MLTPGALLEQVGQLPLARVAELLQALPVPPGLEGLPRAAARERRGWTSLRLARRPGATLAAFGLPAGVAMPLHDHPEMCVLTRVLQGRLRATRLELVAPLVARARPTLELDRRQPPLLTRGGLHALLALEDCVFLDLLAPDYDPPARPCRYYEVASRRSDGLLTLRGTNMEPG